MDRRTLLKTCALTTGGVAWSALSPHAQAQLEKEKLRITNVRSILTAPAGIRLVVVKVETNEPGLYGLGCATFTQRARAVETAVDRFLRPFLVGKDPLRIEDIFKSSYLSSYWRNGPVLNNALSGVDMALWDILGKRAGMPLYQLFGGKCREAVDTYRHASGANFGEVSQSVAKFVEQGYRHVRIQVAVPGQSTYGARGKGDDESTPPNRQVRTFHPKPYVRTIPRLFEHVRREVGEDVELLHDVHERVPPILAIQLAKDLEDFRLFFLEDPFSPEDIGYFKHLRQQSSTPIAMGELFNNPNEWIDIVSQRLIDFIRIHISQIGGLTMARRVAALCDFFSVRTAWHGPGDVSPVGHAANVHLDLATPNFGIQEARSFTAAEQDVFPGCPTLKDGYYSVDDQPGLGVDIDEQLAKKFPVNDDPPFDMFWGNVRMPDGTVIKP